MRDLVMHQDIHLHSIWDELNYAMAMCLAGIIVMQRACAERLCLQSVFGTASGTDFVRHVRQLPVDCDMQIQEVIRQPRWAVVHRPVWPDVRAAGGLPRKLPLDEAAQETLDTPSHDLRQIDIRSRNRASPAGAESVCVWGSQVIPLHLE